MIDEISDMTAISDCLDSSTPFAETVNFHVTMLMTRHVALCSDIKSYNDKIVTIDELLTYIHKLGLLDIDPKIVLISTSMGDC